jgi:hypothetical protein
LRKIRELREKYGPLFKLIERGDMLAEFIKSRPLLKKAFEDLKPDFSNPEEFRECLIEDIGKVRENLNLFTFHPQGNYG